MDLDISLEYLHEAVLNGYMYAYNNIAWVLYLKKDCLNALPYIKKAIELFPDDANCYDTLGSIYECMNENDNAMIAFEKCLELYTKSGNQKCIDITINKIKHLQLSLKRK